MRLRVWAEPGPALGTSVAVQIALISNAPIALRRPRTSNIIRPITIAAMYHTAVPRYRLSWIKQRLSHYTTPLLHATIVLHVEHHHDLATKNYCNAGSSITT